MSYCATKFYSPRAPEFVAHPPNTTISEPVIFDVWPYLGNGGVPLTRNLLQIKLSVSRIRRSFR